MSNSIHKEVLKLEKLLKTQKESFWVKRGEKSAIKHFHTTKKVSAYKNFLKKQIGKVPLIKTIKDFKTLPTPDKNKYLRLYPFEKLFLKNQLSEIPRVFSTTSGSTGEPFYFPRTGVQDKQYQLYAELYLRNNFQIHKQKTLYIDAFPMGPWIGGVFTYEVITRIAREAKYSLSIITTGIDTSSIIQTIEKIGKYYDQIIIGSYGPFAKDVLDRGIHEGINWKKYNIKFVFSAEAFPESFRDYVGNVIGSKNVFFDTLNHYGTVDLGTMSYETPICILIRKLAEKNKVLYEKIFGNIVKIPTLTQYLPELFYFESINNNLYCTSESAIPLARYDLGDHGAVVPFGEMFSLFQKFNIDLKKEARKCNIEKSIWELPFVYVFERSDFSVSYYAFQVYPGPIRKILFNKKIQKKVTGKFALESSFSEDQSPKLIVNVELKKNVNFSTSLLREVQKLIHDQLMKTHSEYRETIKHFGKKAEVFVSFWGNGDQKYFKTGVKQKWIKK
jgi:phenylacetate-CoA ligase